MLLTALAARQRDRAPLSPPMSSFSVRLLILPPCLYSVNLSFFCCDSSSPPESPWGMYISKWSAPLFLTYSIPSVFSPCPHSSITVRWLLPPSASPFILPLESSYPHPPCSAIGRCLFKLRHNIPWLFLEANFSTQIPFSKLPCSLPAPPSSSSSSSWAPEPPFTWPPFCHLLFCL